MLRLLQKLLRKPQWKWALIRTSSILTMPRSNDALAALYLNLDRVKKRESLVAAGVCLALVQIARVN
jgi:hypothetical protein